MDNQRGSRLGWRAPLNVMMTIIIILTVVILILASVIVHRTSLPEVETSEKVKPNVRHLYPGYFRFPQEQKEFEELKREIQNTSSVINITDFTPSTTCTGNIFPVPIHPSYVIDNNACCTSDGSFITKAYWVDIYGVNRTIATFVEPGSGNTARQFFYTETCNQVGGCTFCTCGQRDSFVTAVYVTSDQEYGVSWFSLPGCCKCFNS